MDQDAVASTWRRSRARASTAPCCWREVYAAVGLIEPFDPRPYPPDWMLHRADERFLGFLFDRSHQVEKPEVGDVMMLRVGRAFAHGAIVTRAEPLDHPARRSGRSAA